MLKPTLFILLLLISVAVFSQESDTLVEATKEKKFHFSGQLSGWAQYTPDIEMDFWLGGRYIPQINYKIPFKKKKELLIDFEASANLYGDMGVHFFDSAAFNGNIKPYRVWVRFSSRRTELRLGLQKINFGSATLFRPLMWFDRMDPRDPLKLTDGVYGLLFRYYFQNNANLWFWGLYGNHHTKGYEILATDKKYPEGGMRAQFPVKRGEIAGTYHFRMANTELLTNFGMPIEYNAIGEHKMGFDMKLDVVIGLWMEASWTTFNRNLDIYTNQEMITLGMDYTFGIGNGLNLVFEQMLYSHDKSPFAFSNSTTFSGLSLSYPIGMFDNISAMIYFDWMNTNAYVYLSWQKDYKAVTFHVIGYWNPKQYALPGQSFENNRLAGKGLQFMVVWNH
ncbi:hypothetical protein LJC68_05465 [Bacteroidales bacterium OttesenSCG-928-B11]|nr:hypothetical protein [Bacteroidales bacterium OttesenSCG-928-B11]MDL2326455.1 hypothetical protein [Bacteroidales bacterium OttesenSCG-928-A14]